MTREEIITEIGRYFTIDELVCTHILTRWAGRSWQFLDTDYLHTLLVIRRDILQRPMYCNDHNNGAHQHGMRCNMCDLVRSKAAAYLSSHVLGKAGDFTVSGMTAEEARRKIKAFGHRLPCNVRLEKGVSWLHIDVLPQHGVTDKVYEFSA